ncbi:hypothetical protein [Parasitella parasitica]|uniref:Uncharacterized protein n=1 Tax=Parasitella parasitica TaxID=35722 RepID=A0A0B7NBK7_9FUNG|nr:hypothetical protein [Parasitella parasitica]
MTLETTNQKNNYAFEIRFIDDNIVQVFDIAAKRKQQQNDNALLLPTEYKQEDVLKGQLRYSKLMGSSSNSDNNNHPTPKDAFGLDDHGLPYEHIVTTKISKNRKSTQRNTFFMMGGGANNELDSNFDAISDYMDRNDSGTILTEEVNGDNLSRNTNDTCSSIQQEESQHDDKHLNDFGSIPVPQSQDSFSRSSSPMTQQHVLQEPTLPPAVKQPTSIDQLQTTTNKYSSLAICQPSHSNVTIPTIQDYTSITAVTTDNSENYIRKQPKQPKRKVSRRKGCCCIIS